MRDLSKEMFWEKSRMQSTTNDKKNDKCLWIKGGHGLGNRVLSLETACRYATKNGLSVYVDWNDPIYEQSQNELLELFELQGIRSIQKPLIENYNKTYPKDIRVFTSMDLTKLITEKRVFPHLHPMLAPWRKYGRFKRRFRYLNSIKYGIRNGEFLDKLVKHYDLLCFCCSIPENEPEHFRHVKIKNKKIKAIFNDSNLTYLENDIGLHIRNTDKISGNLNKVVECINKLLNEHPKLKTMHLATDSLNVIKLISSKFQDRLNIQILNITRNEEPLHLRAKSKQEKKKELQDSMLDIYVLSQSKYLLFQENSSFSRFAVALQENCNQCIDWTN